MADTSENLTGIQPIDDDDALAGKGAKALDDTDVESGDEERLPKAEEAAPRLPGREDVPAGGAGADSGSAEVVGIDEEDTAGIANRSPLNDTPGVGTRGPDGRMDRD